MPKTNKTNDTIYYVIVASLAVFAVVLFFFKDKLFGGIGTAQQNQNPNTTVQNPLVVQPSSVQPPVVQPPKNCGGTPKCNGTADYSKSVGKGIYNSPEVREVQKALNSNGACLSIDCDWGTKTEAAFVARTGQSTIADTSKMPLSMAITMINSGKNRNAMRIAGY